MPPPAAGTTLPGTPTPHGHALRHLARQNLDRHPNYILAAFMASGT
jgi:hypothetical protein